MSAEREPAHVAVARDRQLAIVRAMSPIQRLQQAMRMNQRMRQLLALGFRERNPDWTDAQIARAVADRILYARTG